MDLENILKQTDLFSDMEKAKLRAIEEAVHLEAFKKNEPIFNEGDPFDKFYIIKSGEVSIFQHLGSGTRELARLGAGDMFGEMALLISGNRSASAKALVDTECFTLDRETFLQIQKDNNSFGVQLKRLLIKRIENTEQNANRSLLSAYNSLLFSLSSLVEARDNETGGHLYRVQHYCKLLAEKLVEKSLYTEIITPLFIENIFTVSPMHDIGKVAIPDAILQKAGKLTEAEFAVMKTHAEIGAGLFAQIQKDINYPTFEMGYNLTHYHHERFDGSGYPAGLSAQKIPLEARIMAVADVFDALLSKRYYKDAFERDVVIKIISEEKGRHFDPLIADTLLENFAEFEELHRKFS